ncbi:MAG: divalent-cation tolerance protein CutA [Wenzhouxiangella sp.]|nr:divalent-cation tolerance protein CutA [Wenzhouxiangella sp.]
MKPKLCLVMTTCADREQAERLARRLVEQRLAACVSIGSPTVSVYPWEGRVEVEQEIPLSIKTSPKHIDNLKRAFDQIHDYDVPEMLVLPVIDGLQPYFDWADDWMNE